MREIHSAEHLKLRIRGPAAYRVHMELSRGEVLFHSGEIGKRIFRHLKVVYI